MAKLEIRDLQEYQELRTEEMEKVMGGIDTVPLPEKPISRYSIGTWPTPERTYLFKPRFRLLTRRIFRRKYY